MRICATRKPTGHLAPRIALRSEVGEFAGCAQPQGPRRGRYIDVRLVAPMTCQSELSELNGVEQLRGTRMFLQTRVPTVARANGAI